MAKRRTRKEEEQPRELTRKEIRINARTRERNRRITWGAGIVVGLAFLLVIGAALFFFVIQPGMTFVTVGDSSFTRRDFWKRTRLQQDQMLIQLTRYQQLEQQFGGQGFFTQQISQLQGMLSSPITLGSAVLDLMINQEVARQEAAKRGITVTAEEIEQAIRDEVANGQGAVTERQATATATAAIEATATAESWTPTPTPTIDVSAVVTATATPVPTPEPLPTLPILTDEQYRSGLAELETNLKNVADMSLDEYRKVVEARLLNDKLEKAVGEEQVAGTEEQVRARHILLEVREPEPTTEVTSTVTSTDTAAITDTVPATATESVTGTETVTTTATPTATPTPEPRDDAATLALAQELRQQIIDGADFDALARQYSDEPGAAESGGDLGWFTRERMVPEFSEAAFSLPVGEISEPVKSQFGYHLIEVLEKDPARPKEEFALERERLDAYNKWLDERVAEANIDRPVIETSSLPSDLQSLTLPSSQQ